MKKMMWSLLGAGACACLLAITASAAPKPATTVKNTKAESAKAKTENAVRSEWPPETLSGKIFMVDPAQHLLIVKGPDGVPFDMRVTPATHIVAAGKRLTLKDLNGDMQKNISIHFVPERSGDIARSVQLAG